MTTYKRYSVQILGTVDAQDAVILHQAINSTLSGVERFKVKAVSLDEWTDGNGQTREFDEKGKEVVEVVETQNELDTSEEIEVVMQ